jgi:hypothetical protein
MPAEHLTTKLLDLIHMIAVTLVNDFIIMRGLLLGAKVKARIPDDMPGGWAFPPIARGELTGVEAIIALRKEMLEMEDCLQKSESRLQHDWANARGRDPICWGGQKYASGYGALCEFFWQVRDVLYRCWVTSEELNQLRESDLDADCFDLNTRDDQRALDEELRKIEGKNDLLDLLVYAEKEYATLYKEAEEREQKDEQQGEDLSAYRPASEFLDANKHKDYPALRRVLANNPQIRTRKPSPQRLVIHAGDWFAYLKEQTTGAFAALGENPEVVDAFLKDVRERQQVIRRNKAT